MQALLRAERCHGVLGAMQAACWHQTEIIPGCHPRLPSDRVWPEILQLWGTHVVLETLGLWQRQHGDGNGGLGDQLALIALQAVDFRFHY